MDIHQLLLKYWGHAQFRPMQQEIIESVINGTDTIALMPTGGGKSICFQIPAIANEGICIVISPLIALMKDQVENLNKIGIKASAIYTGMAKREIDIILDNCIYGNVKLLYVSPERVETNLFKERFKKMNVNLITVDEAHCISEWGHDFRPAYLNIHALREIHPEVPVLAVTATATPHVIADIEKFLKLRSSLLFKKSFERKNLAYMVLHEQDKLSRLLKILHKIEGSTIIYVKSRKKTKEIAHFLIHQGIKADFYHAGLNSKQRHQKQELWKTNNNRVIVATNAFGMGIDKPDVRLVIHMDLPHSIEAYMQEAGRAGRDEQKAYAILLFEPADQLDLERRISENFPAIKTIKNTYQALGNYFQIPLGAAKDERFVFNITDFATRYDQSVSLAFSCLKVLETEGLITLSDAYYNPSKIKFEVAKNELYEFQVKNTSLDPLIKTILRSYSGAFDNFITCNEQELAKRLNTTTKKIIHSLSYLNDTSIITYIPSSDLPQITFLQERLDLKNLSLSKKTYNNRKQIATKKMESIIGYATLETSCRNQYLLHYFDEENVNSCGICDWCIQSNKTDLSSSAFNTIEKQLAQLLATNALTIEEILHEMNEVNEGLLLKAIRWLLDNDQLLTDEDNKLRWND